ncbi:MAG: MBL fold metallo-hydrolase [Devosia sp.]|nr:MBL fold metallo-hydrolase [Devosia sp.]
MRIEGRWHQLCGMRDGGPMGDPCDCNAYALETEDGLVIFDAGCGRRMDSFTEAIIEIDLAPVHLFLTHAHADHSGGAATVQRRFDVVLHAGRLTSQWLAVADEGKISLAAAKTAGVYPPDYRLSPLSPDDVVADRDQRRIGNILVTAIATPGHSADHFCYLVDADGETTLIAGDAIFAGGKIVLQDTWDCSVADSCASIRKLSGVAFERLLAGHGPPVLSGGRSAIDLALERIDRLLPPANLL